jgi:hypothetical protein
LFKQVITNDVIMQGGWTLTPTSIVTQFFDTASPGVTLATFTYLAVNNFFEDLGAGGAGVTYQYRAIVTAPGYQVTTFLSNTLTY